MRKFGSVIVVLMLLSAGQLLLPGSASAAVGCSQTGCNGKDPQAMGCSPSAYTVADVTYLDYRVELRKSDVCGAMWVRVTASYTHSGYEGQARAYRCSAADSTCFIGSWHDQAIKGTSWSAMWSYTYYVRACGSEIGDGNMACSAPH